MTILVIKVYNVNATVAQIGAEPDNLYKTVTPVPLWLILHVV